MAQRIKKGRDVSGILILDKPLNISSSQAVQRIKRLYGAKKVGHTGSLDPLASGVLPICLGHATKVSQYLLASDKSYQFTMKLGQTTTTGDVEGDVLTERAVPAIDLEKITRLLSQYCGDIQQVPPMYSALKHNGQRLYKLARAGEVVERPARDVTIKSLKLLSANTNSLTIEVCCTKGTYVRTLAEDLGESLGCGAHVTFLRRIKTGPFELARSLTFEQLEKHAGTFNSLDALMLDIDVALLDYPVVKCSEEDKADLCMGRAVAHDGLPNHSLMRLNDPSGKIFGLGKWSQSNLLAPVRIFA